MQNKMADNYEGGCQPLEEPGGGYQYDYVVDPPENLNCPICLSPCREPQILGCCGAKFCYSCISREEAAGRPCPICRERGFKMLIDKEHERKILALKVNCKYKADGCPWAGELRHIERPHLSNKCHYVPTACIYQCGYMCKRSDICVHEEEECERRPPDVILRQKVKLLEKKSENQSESLVAQEETIKEQRKLIEDQRVRLEEVNDKLMQLQNEMTEFKNKEKEDVEGLRGVVEEEKKEREKKLIAKSEEMKNTLEIRLKEVQDKIIREIVNEKERNLREEIQKLNNKLLAFNNEQKKLNEAQAAAFAKAMKENGENTISAMKDDINLLRKELLSKSDEKETKLRREMKASDERINAIDRQYGKFLI